MFLIMWKMLNLITKPHFLEFSGTQLIVTWSTVGRLLKALTGCANSNYLDFDLLANQRWCQISTRAKRRCCFCYHPVENSLQSGFQSWVRPSISTGMDKECAGSCLIRPVSFMSLPKWQSLSRSQNAVTHATSCVGAEVSDLSHMFGALGKRQEAWRSNPEPHLENRFHDLD